MTLPVIPFEIKTWNLLLLFTIGLLTKEEGWVPIHFLPKDPQVLSECLLGFYSLIMVSLSPVSASPGCHLHLLTS